jgi:hypothetical protein
LSRYVERSRGPRRNPRAMQRVDDGYDLPVQPEAVSPGGA